MTTYYDLIGAGWDPVPVEDSSERCDGCGHELAVHDLTVGCDVCSCVYGVDGWASGAPARHTFLVAITAETGDIDPQEYMDGFEEVVTDALRREADSGRWRELVSAEVECVDAWPAGGGR